MMDFSQADHGVSYEGIREYVDDLNTVVLHDVRKSLEDTDGIIKAVEKGWHGQSATQFLSNIEKAQKKITFTLGELQEVFETQIEGIRDEIFDMDANLVEEE